MKLKMNKKLICPKKNDSDLLIPFMIVACGVLLSCITVFFGYDILSDYQDKLVYLFKKAESIGIVSDELYFPATWNREASYDMVPVTDDGNVISDFQYEKYRWKVNIDGGYVNRVLFPIVYYKGYTAQGAEGIILDVNASADGRIEVDLPSGFDGTFVLEFRSPLYWRISEIISLLMLMLLIHHRILERHKHTLPES